VQKIKFRPYFEIFGRFDVVRSRRVRNSITIEGLFDAHCTSGAIDRSDPAEALWRHRTRCVLAHGGADRAGARGHTLCERGFSDFGSPRIGMAAGVTAGRLGPRS